MSEDKLEDQDSVYINREDIQFKENKKFTTNKRKKFILSQHFKQIKKENRLKFLQSKLELNKPNISYELQLARRKGFNLKKFNKFNLWDEMFCYICSKRATLRHHVTPICKGGRNKRNNIVPLCHLCHCKVHPHMHKIVKGEFEIKSKPVKFKNPFVNKTDIIVVPPKKVENYT